MDLDVQLIDSFAAKYSLVWAIETSEITPIIVGTDDSSYIYCFDEERNRLGLAFSPDSISEKKGDAVGHSPSPLVSEMV